jgi:hypothetical protein
MKNNEEMASARREAETIARFDEEEDTMEVYTASPRVYGLLTRRGLEPTSVDTYRGKPTGWFFRFPKWAIIIKPGNTSIRIGGAPRINSTTSKTASSGESQG